MGRTLYKATMIAGGIDRTAGPAAAKDIEAEFREHRPWHEQVSCTFADGVMTLVAFNDYDESGLALSDEFSDCLSAYLKPEEIGDDGAFEVTSVETI